MKDGFIKVAAGMPEVTLANPAANAQSIKALISKADELRVNLLVLPELCITGFTCGDLFFNDALIKASYNALLKIADFTKGKYPLTIVGAPIKYQSRLYNCAVVLQDGKILGAMPKSFIQGLDGFNEKRQFCSGDEIPDNTYLNIANANIPFGKNLIFRHLDMPEFTFSAAIGEELFSPSTFGMTKAFWGAAVIANLAASAETVGKSKLHHNLISATCEMLTCGCVYAGAGVGESSQDAVFSGRSFIYEKDELLVENKPFEGKDMIVSEIDLKKISHDRQNNMADCLLPNLKNIPFCQDMIETSLTRPFAKNPFVPKSQNDLNARAELVLQIQSNGLARRLSHTKSKTAVIGISGGLDSTLALLVAVRAMKLLGRPATDISAVTMPCFGTTDRTRSNSETLCRLLGVSFREINISDSVKQHFADIGQSQTNYNVAYENSQARERTQVLMDVANIENGLVIGTGDLSELALGWATYNGDHMSMYSVNASVPKTLIRHIVRYEAQNSADELKAVLMDILDTPVSPELLPADGEGKIAQKTEDLVGPYELHDFFLYHTLGGKSPGKIFRLASSCFSEYDKKTILHWLTVFTRRFFSQQFKRSCLPDGPAVGSLTLSPRGGLQMPTDACSSLWLKELESLSCEL